jgi:hypothetical protein
VTDLEEDAEVDLKLFLGPHYIGLIEGAFWSDDTGYGVFRPSAEQNSSPAAARVRQFVAFSEDWHRRLTAGADYRSDEWDAFADVHGSGLWRTVAANGTVSPIRCPVFADGGVSWKAKAQT